MARPKSIGEILILVSLLCFLGAYLHFLICFGYIEFDARKGQIGFPERLLLKPVSTTRLILVPMVFGGAAIVAIIAIWTELVLRHLLLPPASPAFSPFWTMLWIGTVLVSLFWWMQTLAWSLPLFKGRVPVVLTVAMTHLLVLILPGLISIFAPDWLGEPGWRWLWGIPAALALVRRAGRVDRAETDATGKMGKPIPDFPVLEPPAPGADTGSAPEIWFRVPRAILVRMAPAGMGASRYLRLDNTIDLSVLFFGSQMVCPLVG